MILLLREKPADTAVKARLDFSLGRFPRSYWKYLGITALFGIGNSSNAFLILRVTDLGASLTDAHPRLQAWYGRVLARPPVAKELAGLAGTMERLTR